jgi:hypothetical protein
LPPRAGAVTGSSASVPTLTLAGARGVQRAGHGGMGMAQQELHAALLQQGFALLQHVRHERTGPSVVCDSSWRSQPGRKVNDSACVAASRSVAEVDSATAWASRRDARGARQHVVRHAQEPFARGGQPRGLRAAVKQRHTQPFLQRADAPAEGGLRQVARVRRTREVAGVGQRQEVFEPGQVQGHAGAGYSGASKQRKRALARQAPPRHHRTLTLWTHHENR